MRPTLFVSMLLAASCLASGGVLRADDAKPVEAKKTYRVLLRERWKPGDVVTRSARESATGSVEIKRGDEPVQTVPPVERLTSYVVVMQCLEADADGFATRSLLYFNAWSIEVGVDKDSSLAGLHVEVSGLGAKSAWKIRTPDAKASEKALAFLAQRYGRNSGVDATFASLEPAREIEVGGGWEGDAHAIATRLVDRGTAVDVEKSRASCTLVSVEDSRARIQAKLSFPTTGQRLPNSQVLPWKEGGVLELALDVTRPIAGGALDAKIHREQRLSGTGVGDGVSVTTDEVVIQDIEVTCGGKMPDVPAAADTAPKDAAPKDAAPK